MAFQKESGSGKLEAKIYLLRPINGVSKVLTSNIGDHTAHQYTEQHPDGGVESVGDVAEYRQKRRSGDEKRICFRKIIQEFKCALQQF